MSSLECVNNRVEAFVANVIEAVLDIAPTHESCVHFVYRKQMIGLARTRCGVLFSAASPALYAVGVSLDSAGVRLSPPPLRITAKPQPSFHGDLDGRHLIGGQ